jgi:hypothetical protein
MPLSADEQIKAIQDIIGKALHPAQAWSEQPSWPLLGLMAYEEERPKYALDETGSHMIGLNLANADIDDHKWARVLEVIYPALLRALNLSDNQFTRFALTEDMQALETINLNGNGVLSAFSFPHVGLNRLVRAELNECAFAELTVPEGMSALQALNLRFGKLEKLVFERDCRELELLDVRDNQLRELALPEGFGRLGYLNVDRNGLSILRFSNPLPALETLWLKQNQLTEVGFLKKLPKLDSVYLQDNQISIIPENLLTELPALQVIYLKGNPVVNLERELIDRDENVLKNLRSILISRSKGTVENNEVKLILVGNSTVGKTSLDVYLRERTFNKGENSTHGIRVNRWEMTDSNGEKPGLDVYIWDFGGQEYYHATHRLFLNNHAMYCLLWNKATNFQDIVPTEIIHNGRAMLVELEHYRYEYWIQNIRFYAADSPIMLVQSRDAVGRDVDPAIFTQFNIEPSRSFHVCLEGVAAQRESNQKDFEVFETTLREFLQVKAAHYSMGRYWFEIKQQLRDRAERGDYRMTWEMYRAFCLNIDPSMEPEELQSLTTYLKEIGVILYYPTYEGLEHTVFIKPTWVTQRIYEVFDEKVKAQHGKFDRPHVVSALEKHRIGKGEAEREYLGDELLNLMVEFKLIFSPHNKPGAFYSIQYLRDKYENQEAFTWLKNVTSHLGFVLHFTEFLPKAVFHQFIAEYGKDAQDMFWKHGIFFTHEDTGRKVFAECAFTERLIRVWCDRSDAGLLSELYQKIFELNEKSRKIEVSVNGEDFVELDKVEEAIRLNNTRVAARNGNAVEVAAFRFITKQFFPEMKKSKIFISYAHADEQYKNDLVVHLSALRNQDIIDDWHDRKIESGEWDEQIEKAMETADIFLLLITPHFLASRYISEREITKAYERYKAGEAKIFPVICDHCDWQLQPVTKSEKAMHPTENRAMYIWLGRFQPYPKDARPIANWSNKNEAYVDVINQLKRALK